MQENKVENKVENKRSFLDGFKKSDAEIAREKHYKDVAGKVKKVFNVEIGRNDVNRTIAGLGLESLGYSDEEIRQKTWTKTKLKNFQKKLNM